MTALLGQIRRRKIYGNAFIRQCQPHGRQCRTHTLAAFGHGLVGQANNGESVMARRQMHLNVDRDRVNAEKSDRLDMCNHVALHSFYFLLGPRAACTFIYTYVT